MRQADGDVDESNDERPEKSREFIWLKLFLFFLQTLIMEGYCVECDKKLRPFRLPEWSSFNGDQRKLHMKCVRKFNQRDESERRILWDNQIR